MRITGQPITLPQTQQNSQRRDLDESSGGRGRDRLEQERNDTVSREREPRQTSQGRTQRINPSGSTSEAIFRRANEADQLPLQAQRALQAFQDNTPTPEQQLGVELVGVDIFV